MHGRGADLALTSRDNRVLAALGTGRGGKERARCLRRRRSTTADRRGKIAADVANRVDDRVYGPLDPPWRCLVPSRIAEVHRIVEAVAVAVRPDACLCHLPPVWLCEEAEFGVVVAGVEVLQACVGVEALADPSLVLGSGGGVEDRGRRLAEGAEGRAAVGGAAPVSGRGTRGRTDGVQRVAVEELGDPVRDARLTGAGRR